MWCVALLFAVGLVSPAGCRVRRESQSECPLAAGAGHIGNTDVHTCPMSDPLYSSSLETAFLSKLFTLFSWWLFASFKFHLGCEAPGSSLGWVHARDKAVSRLDGPVWGASPRAPAPPAMLSRSPGFLVWWRGVSRERGLWRLHPLSHGWSTLAFVSQDSPFLFIPKSLFSL